MSTKKDLGQFFTTNSDYILQGFEETVRGKSVLDPFAGGGDLLTWATKNGALATSGNDIDQSLCKGNISYNDSLVVIEHSQFNITNPPYLAKNKMNPAMKAKYMLDSYEDLYLLSMKRIINSAPEEGIIIIPVNFFSAENSDLLRTEFLTVYEITKVNYFRTQVFEDTTYNVVAFHYKKKAMPSTKQSITFTSFPGGDTITFDLDARHSYRIAGEELSKIVSIKPMETVRLTEEHMIKHEGSRAIKAFFNDTKTEKEYSITPSFRDTLKNNIILLYCIDTNASESGWIKAEDIRTLGKDCLVGKNTSRNIAYVMLPNCPLEMQEKIIPLFNKTLNALRKKYNSLFLTNFRDNDRKRVSFEFCYKLISYCYEQVKSV